MTTPTTDPNELSAIADELEVVATWHTGVRRGKVDKLAQRLREAAGVNTEQPTAGAGQADGAVTSPTHVPDHHPGF